MTSDVSSEQGAVSTSSPGAVSTSSPGAILKQARENAGLTSAQVADQLKIPESYIKGLDENKFDCMPGLVFARGYARSYARVVELAPDEVVDVFDLYTGSDSQDTPHLKPGAPLLNRRHMSPVIAWGATISTIILVGVLSYYGWNKSTSSVEEVPAMTEEVITPKTEYSIDSTVVEPLESDLELTEGLTKEIPMDQEYEEFAPGVEVGSLTVESDDLVNSKTSPDNLSDATVQKIDATVQESEATVQENDAVGSVDVVNKKPAINTDVSTIAKLAIRFADDCWVQIKDMTGKTLFTDTQRAGTELELDVPVSVKVRFGNAKGVSVVNFDGRDIDIKSSFGGRKVASLVLDAAEAG